MERKALISGTADLIIVSLVVLALTISIYAVYAAPSLVEEKTPVNLIPDDFEPFRGEKLREKVEIQTVESDVAGRVSQSLYTVTVSSGNRELPLMEALELHAYCQVEGRESVHRCSGAPGEEEIRTAVEEGMDDIMGVKEGDTRPYMVKAEYRGSELFEVGGREGGSSFVFLGPVPGGEQVKLTLSIARGRLSAGVVE